MPDSAQLARFYDEAYAEDPAATEHGRWRALGAVRKADHVIELCARAAIRPRSTLEVGCGDGALLCELRARGFGGRLYGLEISGSAVAIARSRTQIDGVALYDGGRLPNSGERYDLGVLSHVLEHVPDPAALLAEVAAACAAVVLEVPLEANWSAGRRAKRAHASEIGHLHALDRRAARAIVAGAGLSVRDEISDPLSLAIHRFFAHGPRAQARATVKSAFRSALHRLAPRAARRVFTVHYACLCLPAD